MNLNIVYEYGNKVFNYRVAIIIRNRNQILVQSDDRFSHCTLPGGRCQLTESSVETAVREFKEETGLDIKFVREVGIIENFFTMNDKEYHEMLMIHQFEICDYDFDTKIVNIEDGKKEHISYNWVNIQELENMSFKPEVIYKNIDANEFYFCIHDELKLQKRKDN